MTYTDYVLSKVEKTDGCWVWKGVRTDNGYGQVRIPSSLGGVRRRTTAHRVVYELLVAPIPVGKVLDHLCRNHRCVNPAHLEPVTDRVNILRGEGAPSINSRKTHCGKGHPFDAIHKSGERVTRVCRRCGAEKRRRQRLKARTKSGTKFVETHD